MLSSIDSATARFGRREFALPDFPSLIEAHLKEYPGTRALEAQALSLAESGFAEERLLTFVRSVCYWGRGWRIYPRIQSENTVASMRLKFLAAWRELDSSTPRQSAALDQINRIKGLGRPSFASKHLRFLRPDVCPILDSIIASALCFRSTSEGYAQYAADCLRIASVLRSNRLPNPMTTSDHWRAADVDMALFASIRGYH